MEDELIQDIEALSEGNTEFNDLINDAQSRLDNINNN